MFKIGMTQTVNGMAIEIIRILDDARACEFTGRKQSIVGIYQIEPGRYQAAIWRDDGTMRGDMDEWEQAMRLVPNG
jgi:hypothetical protein